MIYLTKNSNSDRKCTSKEMILNLKNAQKNWIKIKIQLQKEVQDEKRSEKQKLSRIKNPAEIEMEECQYQQTVL